MRFFSAPGEWLCDRLRFSRRDDHRAIALHVNLVFWAVLFAGLGYGGYQSFGPEAQTVLEKELRPLPVFMVPPSHPATQNGHPPKTCKESPVPNHGQREAEIALKPVTASP